VYDPVPPTALAVKVTVCPVTAGFGIMTGEIFNLSWHLSIAQVWFVVQVAYKDPWLLQESNQ
jgi:hypothetical protein